MPRLSGKNAFGEVAGIFSATFRLSASRSSKARRHLIPSIASCLCDCKIAVKSFGERSLRSTLAVACIASFRQANHFCISLIASQNDGSSSEPTVEFLPTSFLQSLLQVSTRSEEHT